PRQSKDINENFKTEEISLAGSGDETNFSFFVNTNNIDLSNSVPGYNHLASGFVGTFEIDDDIQGTLGYQYSQMDYKIDGKSSVQSGHIGVYTFFYEDEYRFVFGLNGDYNMNTFQRNLPAFTRTATSEFGSYLVNVTGNVMRNFGSRVYVAPRASMDISYAGHGSFEETGADSLNIKMSKAGYTLFEPRLGARFGLRGNMFDLYGDAEYSYALGTMKETQKASLSGFEGTYDMETADTVGSSVTLILGAALHTRRISLSLECGKTFENGNDTFASGKFGFRF
ncbi:MAG: autotransporter outer membrane beta-barrel domain-containing protein, partial [Fusobacteriaceae bacterium]